MVLNTTDQTVVSRFRIALSRRRNPPNYVLASYHQDSAGTVTKALGFLCLAAFCLVYGFIFSVLVPNYFAFLMAPIAIFGVLVIWVLPASKAPPIKLLDNLFFATFVALIAWPDYLAISLPGLPWITLLRLTSFPLALTLLVCLSSSEAFRSALFLSLKSLPSIPILLAVFVAIQIITLSFSHDIASSVQRFIVAQTTWIAVFFVAAFVFQKPGRIVLWAKVLWALGVFVSVIAVWEYHIGRLPWLGHIPRFLSVPDESVQHILAGSVRAGTTRYRAQATFSTPLGLAEYIAITLPFVMHFATRKYAMRVRAAALASIPILLFAVNLSDAKLGTVGCLVDIVLFIFLAAFRSWKSKPSSLVAASTLYSYPLGLLALFITLTFSGRFKNLILGTDGSHDASTNARMDQYTIGLHKILQWPFGYGIGMGGDTLGYGKDRGFESIDTYYLSVVLEYGVAGFVVYFGMFAIAIYESLRRVLAIQDLNEDRSFLMPISIALITFIIVKSVFSQTDNHPVIFMILGALMALVAQRQGTTEKTGSAAKLAGGRHPAEVRLC